MPGIGEQLHSVRERIDDACRQAGRKESEVGLIAVSKTFPAEAVIEAFAAGQRCFGESRLQEAESKLPASPDGIDWHFIGRVQRNKVRRILTLFGTVHGIDSLRLASHVDRIAGELGLRPEVFLQVNIGREDSKGGFDPELISDEMDSLMALEHLNIRGLMCIPPIEAEDGGSRRWFAMLRELRDDLCRRHGASLPCLSMGMSGDYVDAILEGATHVRVGSAIFGTRSYRVDGELG